MKSVFTRNVETNNGNSANYTVLLKKMGDKKVLQDERCTGLFLN